MDIGKLTRREFLELTGAAGIAIATAGRSSGLEGELAKQSYSGLAGEVSELMRSQNATIEYNYSEESAGVVCSGTKYVSWEDVGERDLPYEKLVEIKKRLLESSEFHIEGSSMRMYVWEGEERSDEGEV